MQKKKKGPVQCKNKFTSFNDQSDKGEKLTKPPG